MEKEGIKKKGHTRMKIPPGQLIRYYGLRIWRDMGNLLKWLLLASLTGVVVGACSSVFARALTYVTRIRGEYPWVILTLPLAGLVIVFLYQKIGKEDRGTNQVLSFIRSKDEVPFRAAPLIFISTILTHLAGGSAGREGAAIQLGGSIGNQLGRWIRLDEEDRHVIVMCGMSGAFAAVFGTPMAAAVFAMEVVSVGIMYYAALLPCVISALIASGFCRQLRYSSGKFSRKRCCKADDGERSEDGSGGAGLRGGQHPVLRGFGGSRKAVSPLAEKTPICGWRRQVFWL